MASGLSIESLRDLIVCPQCDAIYRLKKPSCGQRAVCDRCHTVLITPRKKAGLQIIAISLAIVILIVSALFLPFLTIRAGGASNAVSILDAAFVFSTGAQVALAVATAGLILFIPLCRVLLSLYVLIPIVRDRPPAHHARRAFALSERLKPWSMAEIFALGCAVALIKVGELADVAFGAAFWLFAALVVLVVAQDALICRWSVWNSLDKTWKS